jgi:hypothetical protein
MATIPSIELIEEKDYISPTVRTENIKEVPNKIRFLVEGAPNLPSKIATLEKFYDNVNFLEDENNFIVSNEGGDQFQLDNKKKINFGDVIDISKELTEIVGSTAGAIGGTAIMPGVGTVAGSGGGMALGAEIFEQVAKQYGTEVLRTNKEHLTQRATDFAFGSISQVVAPYIIKGGKYIIVGGKKQIDKAGKRLQNYIEAGVKPSLGQVTQNQAVQTVEMFTANIPGGSGVISQFAQEAQDNLGKYTTQVASKLINKTLPANEVQVGQSIKSGIKDGVNSANSFVGRFNGRAGVLYGDVNKYVKPDSQINLSGTIKTLSDMTTPIKGAEETSKKFANTFLSEVLTGLEKDVLKNNGSLPYEAVSALRGRIGKKLASFELIPDVDKAQLKLVYAAISKDLEKGILKNGGAKAYNAFRRANNFYRSGLKRIDDYLEPIYKTADPDKITSLLINSSKEGSTRVNAIKKSLTPEQYKIFLSSIIERLGRIQPSQGLAPGSDEILESVGRFSSETFLTNWNKLSPKAKEFLFSGKGFKGLDKDLDKIANISSIIRESGKTFRNPSGTADRLVGQGIIFGSLGGAQITGNPGFLLTLPLTILGANQTAKLLTNPRFVSWMAQGTDIASTKGYEGVAKHLTKLGVIMSNADSDSRQAINEYLEMLINSNANKPK